MQRTVLTGVRALGVVDLKDEKNLFFNIILILKKHTYVVIWNRLFKVKYPLPIP